MPSPYFWAPLLVALAPILLVSLAAFDRDARAAASFGLGAMGWVAALMARTPFLAAPILLYGLGALRSTWYPVYTAAISGLIEEPVRYAVLRLPGFASKTLRRIVSLGLGWSLVEAVLVFAAPLVIIGGGRALPGAVERLSATLAHVAFTLLVAYSISKRRSLLLLVPIALHSALNLSALAALRAGLSAWTLEAVIAAEAAALLCAALVVTRAWTERQYMLSGTPRGT